MAGLVFGDGSGKRPPEVQDGDVDGAGIPQNAQEPPVNAVPDTRSVIGACSHEQFIGSEGGAEHGPEVAKCEHERARLRIP